MSDPRDYMTNEDWNGQFDDPGEYSPCMTCHGEGMGQECELELDWINYGPGLVTCPDCDGDGIECKGRG